MSSAADTRIFPRASSKRERPLRGRKCRLPKTLDTVAGILASTWTQPLITFILPALTVFPGEPTMFGPGEYVPDPTEGLVDVKDLPAPQLSLYSRRHKQTPCPRCGDL